MTDIVTTTPAPIMVRDAATEELVREQFGLQEATSLEIDYFFGACNRLGLDPISKQIYAIMRYDKRAGRKKLTIQVSIDGYRSKAAETGEYAGSDDAVFVGKTPDGKPAQATVTVYRIVQGHRCPFTATARWAEYVGDGQWGSKPHIMLAKCAEALALRKAFPAELGGTYTTDEMNHADHAEVVEVAGLTDEQAARIVALSDKAGIAESVRDVRISNMKPSEFDRAVATLEQRIVEQEAAEDAKAEGKCPACKGAGEVDNDTCGECGGTGEADQ